MFPLRLVVFPGEKLNLHIFEPRYRELIKECVDQGTTFGIPPFLSKEVSKFGTEVKLVKIEREYDDGKYDIRTEGQRIFQVRDFFAKAEGKLYPGAYIDFVEPDMEGDIMIYLKILEKTKELYEILNINKSIPEDPNEMSTYELAHHVGFSIEQEYEFLRIPEERMRQTRMLSHLEHLIPIVREMETLRERVKLNGHFKDAIPPDLL